MKPHEILFEAGITPDMVDDFGLLALYVKTLQKGNVPKVYIIEAVRRNFDLPETPKLEYRVIGAPTWTWGRNMIDDGAMEQLHAVARSPVVERVAIMPDGHLGYGMPIGGVAELRNALSPSYIGYDIACRVTMTLLDISHDQAYRGRDKILNSMRRVTHFGGGAAKFDDGQLRMHPVMADPLWAEIPVLRQYRDLAQSQLGSSGAGNHFIDFGVVRVVKDAPWLGLSPGDEVSALMTHSGSRGVGHKLATYYMQKAIEHTNKVAHNVPKEHAWLSLDTEIGQEYWQVVQLMGRYAQANHHLIHAHFLADSGLWHTPLKVKGTEVDLVSTPFMVVENHHNFAWATDVDTFIHRKGATPAAKDQAGIIPGTSGSLSYLVNGLGNPDSMESSSHGAGRPFSRTEAKRRYDDALIANHYFENDIETVGVNADEVVSAYKNIRGVMDAQTDLVEPVARFKPIAVVMGGNIKSDDGD